MKISGAALIGVLTLLTTDSTISAAQLRLQLNEAVSAQEYMPSCTVNKEFLDLNDFICDLYTRTEYTHDRQKCSDIEGSLEIIQRALERRHRVCAAGNYGPGCEEIANLYNQRQQLESNLDTCLQQALTLRNFKNPAPNLDSYVRLLDNVRLHCTNETVESFWEGVDCSRVGQDANSCNTTKSEEAKRTVSELAGLWKKIIIAASSYGWSGVWDTEL